MEHTQNLIQIGLNTAQVKNQTKALTAVFAPLHSILQKLSTALQEAFSVKGYKAYLETAGRYGKELANGLLALQLNFGRLKAAIADAAAPLAGVFVPWLNQALRSAIAFAQGISQVLGALLSGIGAGKNFADTAQGAAQSQKELASALTSTGKAMKGYVAAFDQLDRLPSPSGGGSASGQTPAAVPAVGKDTLSPQLQAIVDNIRRILEPLRTLDFTPLRESLARLKTALAPFSQALFSGLQWAYEKLLVPLAAWTAEDLLPAFLDTLSAAAAVLNETLIALQPMATWLWETFLQPLAQWTGGVILQVLQWLWEKLDALSQWIRENQPVVENIALAIAGVAAAFTLVNGVLDIWNGLSKLGIVLIGGLVAAIGLLSSPITGVYAGVSLLCAGLLLLIRNWDAVKTAAQNAWQGMQQAWQNAGDWIESTILDPVRDGFRSTVNGIIGFLNSLLRSAVAGINTLVNALNGLQFTVPSWVPGLGGNTLGFQLRTVTAPQIPYLAQGAVIPPNREFLAVLGDQRHGTNIEAPLSTIEDAVASVLNSGQQIQLLQRQNELLLQILQNIGVTLDGRQMAKGLAPYLRDAERAGGW